MTVSGTNLATIREPKIRAKYGQAESFHVSAQHPHWREGGEGGVVGVGGLGLHSLHPDKTRVYPSGQQVQCQSNALGRRRQGEGCLQAFLAFRRAALHEAAELFSCHRAAPVFGSMSERDKQRDGAVQKRA